jgi:hypothetical protein
MSGRLVLPSDHRDDPEEWAALQKRCMAQDFSWDRAARQYEHVFTGGWVAAYVCIAHITGIRL